MNICRLSLLLPLLCAVMVTQVSADFWRTIGKIALGVGISVAFGKSEADIPDHLKEGELVELAQNLTNECIEADGQSFDEDLAEDILLNKFRQLDENGDMTLTGLELKKFQEFTAAEFCKKLEKEQMLKP